MASLHFPRIGKWLFQSPPGEYLLWHIRALLIGALRQGPIPQHVAFVMDGNRRFAKTHGIETIEGHNLGFEALAKVLEVCYKTGVKVVTIYAFSVENFKRSRQEVGGLMEMAKLKLDQLSQHGELLNRYGACIRILGQKELIPEDVQGSVNKAVGLTASNNRAILNICFPYTSRDEITTAIRSVVAEYSQPLKRQPSAVRALSEHRIAHNIRSRRLSTLREESRSPVRHDRSKRYDQYNNPFDDDALTNGEHTSPDDDPTYLTNGHHSHAPSSTSTSTTLAPTPTSTPPLPSSPSHNETPQNYPDPESITAETLSSHMYTAGTPPLDLLIRTSGVQRLSDFMLWQCHEDTSVVFLDCLWPDFDLWKFLPVLLEWQFWRRRVGSEAQEVGKSI